MPAKVTEIKADNIDGAAGEIIGFLDDTSKGNVIYFNGWLGLGASAVLKVVAKRLGSSSSSSGAAAGTAGFDKIIHVDCSLWESKRALQKAIAEELGLPQSVMAIFDQRDEDDDFNGVEQGSRGVIEDVTRVIGRTLEKHRFLVVFHNGSGGYIDLYECGLPIITLFSNKVLWTSQGRFQLESIPWEKIAGLSDVAISWEPQVVDDDKMYDKVWELLREEAKEVATYTGIPEPDMNPKIVEECILYKWALRDDDRGIDWGTHAPNYWICDGIIQTTKDGDRSAWEIGNALHRNMRLDWHWVWAIIIEAVIEHYGWRPNDRWVLATRQYLQVPPQVTSFFQIATEQATAKVPAGMFDRSGKSRLRVIQLSWCAFSFSSPPFLCCSNLRFLLLHHCKDNDDGTTTHHGGPWRECFRNLWVLDLSYTDWYWLLSEEMMDVMADLRELNVKGVKRWSMSHLSSSSSLKTIVLDGFVLLEKLGPNVLPPSLESFSFFNNVAEESAKEYVEKSAEDNSIFNNVAAKINSISFRGCTLLKSLLLRGFFESLVELDMSGTAVKTLDLSAMLAPHLRRLFLLGCEKLRAILWPRECEKLTLDMLRIDTSRAAWAGEEKSSKEAGDSTSSGSSSMTMLHGGREPTCSDYYFFIRDARLLRSLLPVRYCIDSKYTHIEIYSSPTSVVSVGGSKGATQGIKSSNNSGGEQQVLAILQQPTANLYADIADAFKDQLQAGPGYKGDGDTPATMWMHPCPTVPDLGVNNCYLRIQDEIKAEKPTVVGFIFNKTHILHVHDILTTNIIHGSTWGTTWDSLRWYRLERCPKLEGSVFAKPVESYLPIYPCLETFWASQLLKACYIWNWSTSYQPSYHSFGHLKFLHLDNCPRLIHVLPLSKYMTLDSLVTLEIVYCGDLKEVFPLEHEQIF